MFIGNYVITVLVSLFACLAFESPIVIIEKAIFGRNRQPREETSETSKSNLVTDDDNGVSHENGKV